ncbi:11181_t:CDS:2 [Racocetra persica]|uniref:11181_t:CDS:1 n=1 Tax=Racocetra persica TaxID=160502 RepID=A0ACA9KV93_9GLOM|nr:11181_t:CDS:2 [Racocetra persica]
METNKENSRKRNVDLVEETENSLESEKEYEEYATNRAEKSHKHYEATCYYYISKKS